MLPDDYKKIWTKFCFLDESGSLNSKSDNFFTVGCIKCSQPYYLNSRIIYERNKRNFHDEMKFNKLSRKNIEFAKFALNSIFSTKSISFSSYTLDKQGTYFNNHFGNDPWRAYEDISIRLLKSTLPKNEILIVIADHVLTPKNIRFEVDVKRRINDESKRLAVAGVCRFDSRSNDLLQITDLIIGAVNYDLKIQTGLIPKPDLYKLEFLRQLKSNLGVENFMSGCKNYIFNIFVDKDVKQRLPFKNLISNEKEPSS